ncbi:hypothetical protein [Streptomyces sp. 351MFTsu5.1]|uniref:hypothetical protein n=1 Tax=Streptomyces sp. 351MFTsu5.1 TaxID=1172180 RepID=UPI00038212E8|nr:hypothetical protein [Streptomyces sp. 351MFTsu5.1]
MKVLDRAPLLALLAVTSCGIPATGVVEAGAPASGALPLTQVYFVENGRLVAVPRNTGRPGDPTDALRLLMDGPLAGERAVDGRGGLTTEVPALPTALALPSPATDEPGSPLTDTSGAAGNSASDTPTATVAGNTMTIRLPPGMAGLSELGVRQLVCTATAAYRLTRPSTPSPAAEVTGGGDTVRVPDARCPAR